MKSLFPLLVGAIALFGSSSYAAIIDTVNTAGGNFIIDTTGQWGGSGLDLTVMFVIIFVAAVAASYTATQYSYVRLQQLQNHLSDKDRIKKIHAYMIDQDHYNKGKANANQQRYVQVVTESLRGLTVEALFIPWIFGKYYGNRTDKNGLIEKMRMYAAISSYLGDLSVGFQWLYTVEYFLMVFLSLYGLWFGQPGAVGPGLNFYQDFQALMSCLLLSILFHKSSIQWFLNEGWVFRLVGGYFLEVLAFTCSFAAMVLGFLLWGTNVGFFLGVGIVGILLVLLHVLFLLYNFVIVSAAVAFSFFGDKLAEYSDMEAMIK